LYIVLKFTKVFFFFFNRLKPHVPHFTFLPLIVLLLLQLEWSLSEPITA
jgi:hypothetical protein